MTTDWSKVAEALSKVDLLPALETEQVILRAPGDRRCYFDVNGRPLRHDPSDDSLDTRHEQLLNDLAHGRADQYHLVDHFHFEDGILLVSTVYLMYCVPASYSPSPPIVWETLLQLPGAPETKLGYFTEAAARRGHQQIINVLDAMGLERA